MSSSAMSIARAREILESVEKAHEAEKRELGKAVETKDAIVQDLNVKLQGCQADLLSMRQERDSYKQKVSKREDTLTTERTEHKVAIATLEAEKEMLAERDKEARNELDRLHHIR